MQSVYPTFSVRPTTFRLRELPSRLMTSFRRRISTRDSSDSLAHKGILTSSRGISPAVAAVRMLLSGFDQLIVRESPVVLAQLLPLFGATISTRSTIRASASA